MNLATDLAILWTGSLLVADGRSLALGLQGHLVILGLVTCLWLLLGLILRHYDPTRLRPRVEDLGVTSLLVASVIVVITGSELLLPDGTPMPTLELLTPVVFAPIVALRFLVFRPRYDADAPAPEAIIVGTGALARATADSLGARVRIKGFVRVAGDAPDVEAGRVLGELPALCQVLVENPVDEVYVAEDAGGNAETLSRVAAICESLGLAFAVPLPTFRLGRARAAGADDGYVHYWPDEAKPYQRAAKRLLDVTASALALFVLAPLLLVVAALIKLDGGPIFYRQRRVGLHGRPFDMLKFRSMVVDAEARRAALEALNEQAGPVFKIRDDPRITRIGRFIRRFSIDELPQLLNVLRGEMSLVGPRPPIPTEVDLYETWQRRRLSVRPGITCIWQVSGRNEISFDRWMLLDMQYIDHWSLRLDVELLFKTIPAVFSARGAS